jgi:glycogen debranching enzyme
MESDPPVAQQGALSTDRVNSASLDREPLLHGSVVCLAAPSMSISGYDGQIRARSAGGQARADGVFHRDQRVLSHAVVTVDGVLPEPLGCQMIGADSARFTAIVRSADDVTPDPVLRVERTRGADGSETLRVRNSGAWTRELTVTLTVAADAAQIAEVRAARRVALIEPHCLPHKVTWKSVSGTYISLHPSEASQGTISGSSFGAACVTWKVSIPPQRTWQTDWVLRVEDEPLVDHPVAPSERYGFWALREPIGDLDLDRFVRQSLTDLSALLLADPGDHEKVFAAAGAPWYLTLFGRDSLWTARMMLPLGTRLAAGTLGALASRQGQSEKRNLATEEERGKILHELRRGPTRHQFELDLPARYYGSVDATPLFVLLYAEAVEAGLDQTAAVDLLPNVCAALKWVLAQSRSGAPEWLRYESGNRGALFNHGWKDSTDAMVPDQEEFRVAAAPITLSEVQAYVYEAISKFVALTSRYRWLADELAKPHLNEYADMVDSDLAILRAYAEFFKREFHAAFSCEDYYAMAIDGDGALVTGLTSNMGHLLGTGILDDHQSAQVANLLGSDELNSGWGLRTRARGHHYFNPLGYHSGAVWAHDTAIAIRGLSYAAENAVAEHPKEAVSCAQAARRLGHGLIDAAAGFDYRIPELYAGDNREPGVRAPLPFAAACRPQAWSAASAVAVLDAFGRLDRLGLSE